MRAPSAPFIHLDPREGSGLQTQIYGAIRRAILDEWVANGDDLAALVHHIVVHEVGHHFGLSDDDMHALEEVAD